MRSIQGKDLIRKAAVAIGLLIMAGCGQPVAETTAAETTAVDPAPPASPAGEAPEPEPRAELMIHEPRAQLMPGMGAGYLSVHNPGDEADRLVSIETAAAKAAETHETVDDDGVMRMVAHPDGFDVPAGGSLELTPGGKHIMLIEPQEPAGEAIRLTLHFERQGAVEVEVPVATPDEMAHEGGMHH